MTPKISIIDNHAEGTRDSQMRSSSVGSAFKRLFSRSPVRPPRSNSSVPALGTQTNDPQDLATGEGQRRRIPPNSIQSQPVAGPEDLPNFHSSCPIQTQRDRFNRNIGGLLRAQQTQQQTSRSAMASHRGGHPEVDGGNRMTQSSVISEIPVQS